MAGKGHSTCVNKGLGGRAPFQTARKAAELARSSVTCPWTETDVQLPRGTTQLRFAETCKASEGFGSGRGEAWMRTNIAAQVAIDSVTLFSPPQTSAPTTVSPTASPTAAPTKRTAAPTSQRPTAAPTQKRTKAPTVAPTKALAPTTRPTRLTSNNCSAGAFAPPRKAGGAAAPCRACGPGLWSPAGASQCTRAGARLTTDSDSGAAAAAAKGTCGDPAASGSGLPCRFSCKALRAYYGLRADAPCYVLNASSVRTRSVEGLGWH